MSLGMSGHITSTQAPRPKFRTSKPSSRHQQHMMPNTSEARAAARGSYNNASHNPSYQRNFSSPDSDTEIMVDDLLVQPTPRSRKQVDRQGRVKDRGQPRPRSRGHSLDNLLTSAEKSMNSPASFDEHGIYYEDESSEPEMRQYVKTYQPQQESSYNRRRTRTDDGSGRMFYQQEKQEPESREVFELQMRIQQMEKTLRWWSDCTANWREKWTKVRAERNRAREELKRTKVKLEDTGKEVLVLREQSSVLLKENVRLKSEGATLSKDEPFSDDNFSALETSRTQSGESTTTNTTSTRSETKIVPKLSGGNSTTSASSNTSALDEDQLAQKVAALQLKVEESVKTIHAERNARLSLHKTIEDLEQQLSTYKKKHEEMKVAKQDASKQLSRIQESHRSDLVRINQNLEEELENRSQMERKIHDLREEIERLQEENTSEWGKRERLETEKLQLERDNKRLKTNGEELTTEMERRRKSTAEERDRELQHAQIQLHDSTEELNDLRRQYAKDQKLLEDKQEELSHSKRRSEKHETEVRALRNRVEEIKKHQTSTEDELDVAQNQTRKLLRVVEEKDEEMEKMQMQIGQLQTRIRREAPTPSSWQKQTFSRNTKDPDLTLSSDSSSDV